MDVANCPRCGKLFSRMSSPICEKCEKEEEDIFQRVKTYVDENSNSSLEQVATATGVSVKKITKYLRDGRLEASEGMGAGSLVCDSCGKPIPRGRYCDACVITLNQQVTDAFAKPEKPKVVMHTRSGKAGR